MIIKRFSQHKLVISLILCITITLLHAFYYYPFIADDTLISLRYAGRLIHGQGLTWNDGEYVEGYTNLLWVLLNALLGAFGADLILSVRVLGVASACALVLSFFYYIRKTTSPAHSFAVFSYTGLLLCLSPPIAAWVPGGLENLLLASLCAFALAQILIFFRTNEPSMQRLYVAAFFLGFLVLTRADAPIIVVGSALSVFAFTPANFRRRFKAAFIVAGVPAVFFASQVCFRLWYYGDPLPNTYYAKFAYTSSRYNNGITYWENFFYQFIPLFVVLVTLLYRKGRIIGFGNSPRKYYVRQVIGTVFVVFGFYGSYVTVTGGDIFPAYRHGLIAIVLFAFLFIEFIDNALDSPKLWRKCITHACIMSGLAGYFFIAHNDAINVRAKTERWEWECKGAAEKMQQMWGKYNPVIAVTAAGCLPYFSGFTAIDMYGLNDRFLARNHTADFGYGYMGHELMNPAYVLSRKPDIIVFDIADYPEPNPAFADLQEFQDEYKLYTDPDMYLYAWLRNDFYEKTQNPGQ